MRISSRVFSIDTSRLVAVALTLSLAILAGAAIGSNRVGADTILAASGAAAAALILITMSISQAQIALLSGVLLVLTVHPTARVVAPGNIPLYSIDILIGLLLVTILVQVRRGAEKLDLSFAWPLPFLVMLFWLPSTVLSYFNEIALTGVWLETTYMLARNLLSISMFFLIAALARSPRALRILLWCLVIGMAITALLSIINSLLPADHPLLAYLDNLTPADLSGKQTQYLSSGQPVRSRALIGGPNALGSLIAAIWPLAFGMFASGQFRRCRLLLLVILLTATLGLFTTYSRTAYLSLALVVAALAFHGIRGQGRALRIVVLLLTIALIIGIEAGAFEPEFILGKFASLRTAPGEHFNQARVEAYVNMVPFLVSHPLWLATGRGLATYDLTLRRVIRPSELALSDVIDTENHSLIVMTFYQRGLLSAIILVLIWLVSLWLLRTRRPSGGIAPVMASEYGWLVISMQATLISLIPSILFDHFFNSSLHMQTLMFVIFGLAVVALRVTTTKNLSEKPSQATWTRGLSPLSSIFRIGSKAESGRPLEQRTWPR